MPDARILPGTLLFISYLPIQKCSCDTRKWTPSARMLPGTGRAEKSNDGKSIELSTSKREIAEENSPKYLMQVGKIILNEVADAK